MSKRIWVISPHESSDYDEVWLPCDTDDDHKEALDYAIERLTELWDQYDYHDPRPASVTIQMRDVDEEDYQRSQT